jgi:tRNA threonylcarbamoyladenosine biosynthesis protein TsaB
MKHILVIQTALDEAFACLSREGAVTAIRHCTERKDHAAFLHPAIDALLHESGLAPAGLDAVGVIDGPGSYTGLRVGMACAKGLCLALSIPLVTVNTLDWMAASAPPDDEAWACPMIDARRMEVFTALYDAEGRRVQDPMALILSPDTFSDILEHHPVRFFGSGAPKWQGITPHATALFPNIPARPETAAAKAWARYLRSDFADLAYAEPFYGKAFHSTLKTG